MLLIIPAIDIAGGKCVQMVRGTEGYVYSDHPVEMAKLWRKENAKSLHVTDVDGAREGRLVNFETIELMVKTVDIPIELGGGFRSLDEVKKALDLGIYRVVLETMLIENPEEARRALETWGPSKIVAGISVLDGIVRMRGWTRSSGIPAVSLALNAKELGFKRILYTEIAADGTLAGPNIPAIRQIAEASRLRITVSGGVSGLDDLLRLQELEPLGLDSAIIGRALYENRFSCQNIWRLCEAGEFPYTARV